MKKEQEFNSEFYTKYEKARIIGARALQLSMNAPLLLKISKEELETMRFDPLKIAEKEFFAGVLPITVRRPLPQKVLKESEGEEVEVIEKVEEEIEKTEEVVKKEKKVEEKVEEVTPDSGIPEIEEAEEEATEEPVIGEE